MAIPNVPSGDDAFYINEQKSVINSRIADSFTPAAAAVTIIDSPTAAQIASAGIVNVNLDKAGQITLPNLSNVLKSGDSTIVYLRNISAFNYTIAGASGVTVNATQYTNVLNTTTAIARTYVAIQGVGVTDYYAVA